MEAYLLMFGLWLSLPVPAETEFIKDKVTYCVTNTVQCPGSELFPVQVRQYYRNSDRWKDIGWMWQESFDKLGVDRVYVADGPETPVILAGWQIQLLRLQPKAK